MAAAIKMDELLVSWLGNDTVWEEVQNLVESYRKKDNNNSQTPPLLQPESDDTKRGVIPPFYPKAAHSTTTSPTTTSPTTPTASADTSTVKRWKNSASTTLPPWFGPTSGTATTTGGVIVRDQVQAMLNELGTDAQTFGVNDFTPITKEICQFPSFFAGPLFHRISEGRERVSIEMLQRFYQTELEPYDASERFFRLLKQPQNDYIGKEDFVPYIKELLNDHPGLEFLSNHAEFQEKYAITVVTRIFYSVNKCHSGKITLRQIRRSDLLDAFAQVDDEEDINKVTRYFSYEHFYVLYCRFWELDHDRDYRITREDLLKYGDHSLSHMIVDRIFDAAPRPFQQQQQQQQQTKENTKEYLSYEDFIFFMLSEEDKANEISVKYWFTCVDVDGDGKLNNMEMRSFYAVQLHRMQCMGHEVVPFEDMLCQMIDMIKPANQDFLVSDDFLQPECAQVSGALFDALFNINKYLLFEQRDPFVERQKREDEFETDWDRFACIDYNRLAMEEEAREEEAMEIDWVTVDDDDDGEEEFSGMAAALGGGASEAPF